jgi:hypothetical protein
MGLLDFLRRLFGGGASSSDDAARDAGPDPTNLTLADLRSGYMVDFELQTWTVVEHNQYDYQGFLTDEWKLRNVEDETIFIEYEDDDEAIFTLARRIPIQDVHGPEGDAPIDPALRDAEAPPDAVTYDGTRYELVESGPAAYLRKGQRAELSYWMYESSDGDVLTLERYGEQALEASAGRYVEPFEFDNILPRGTP